MKAIPAWRSALTGCRGQQGGLLQRLHPLRQQRYNSNNTIAQEIAGRTAEVKKQAKNGTRSKRFLYAVTGISVVGAGTIAVSDDAKHIYRAAQRSGRVVSTLLICVNDYRTTLNHQHDSAGDYEAMLKACHKRCADRTFTVLEKNGSIFIKLGQHLSSLNYLLPVEWCDTFIPLQDKCPVSPFESIQDMVLKDTGEPLSAHFSDFSKLPIGAASLAQVHMATLKETGQRVAVKVQHPALDEWADLDLALTKWTFEKLKYFFPEYDLTWLSDEMQASLPKELDFREEGKNAKEAKTYFAKIKELPVVIPGVMWAQRRIVVMEAVTGKRLDDLEYLDSNGIDRDQVSAALARIFNEMIFGRDAPLHCDPHGGNLAIRLNNKRRGEYNFDIIIYDHGLYRNPPLDLRRKYAKLWLAVIDADEPRMRRYAYEVAGITDEQFPLFASAITGRDYSVITSSITKPRSKEEQQNMSSTLSGNGGQLIEQLLQILGSVPRVILLILKTNDLTRSLDENLHTRQGPIRSFLILARYAARTVYEEQLDNLRGSVFAPRNLWSFIKAWSAYERVQWKLSVYEYWLALKRMFGVKTELPV